MTRPGPVLPACRVPILGEQGAGGLACSPQAAAGGRGAHAMQTQMAATAEQTHPFDREALFRQLGPLAVGTFLGLVYLASRQAPEVRSAELLRAALLAALALGATVFAPWERLPAWARVLPPIFLLAAALLVRDATGGSSSVFTQLAVLPVLWLAAYASRRQLWGGLVAVAAALLGPAAVGAGAPSTRTLLVVVAAVVLGSAEQRFFERIREHADQLRQLARVDPLTGTANRRAWEEEIQRATSRSTRDGRPLSIALLDLDRFKSFNDLHGHQAGDRLLKEVTAAWRDTLRDHDLLARIGGDEFGIILPDCPLDAALGIAGRLGDAAGSECTLSAGVAQWVERETTAALIARADAALYRAKEGGRGRTVAAPPAIVGAADTIVLA